MKRILAAWAAARALRAVKPIIVETGTGDPDPAKRHCSVHLRFYGGDSFERSKQAADAIRGLVT